MFQSIDEGLIIKHRFVISFLLLFNLLHEQFLLDEGIIQLSVSIAELMMVNEKLESFSQSRFGSVIFGQWRHRLRMFHNESRVQTLRFKEASDQLINKSVGSSWIAAINVMFSTLFVEEDLSLLCFDVFRNGLSQLFLKFFHH